MPLIKDTYIYIHTYIRLLSLIQISDTCLLDVLFPTSTQGKPAGWLEGISTRPPSYCTVAAPVDGGRSSLEEKWPRLPPSSVEVVAEAAAKEEPFPA